MRLQRVISQDASEWSRRGEPGDRQYRGSQLDEALAWSKPSWPNKQEKTFLQASAAERERLQQVEEERKLQE